jgi:hypothetical protein
MMFPVERVVPFSFRGLGDAAAMTAEQTQAARDADVLFRSAQDLVTFPLFTASTKREAQQLADSALVLFQDAQLGAKTPAQVEGEIASHVVTLDELRRKRRINIALLSLAGIGVVGVGGYAIWTHKRKRNS